MSSAQWRAALAWVAALAGLSAAASSMGCKTDAYCFKDCVGDASTGTTSATGTGGAGDGGAGGEGGCIFNCGSTSSVGGGGPGGGGPCMPTNGGIEKCDTVDNDCNGQVDDLPDLDPTSPKTCGTCSNNCYALVTNWDPTTIACDAPNPGTPGTCTGTCATDYFDIDGNGTCEYYCIKNADNDVLCNNKDDDCDGTKDEEVDLCSATTNCGKCGVNCVVLHGTPKCAQTDAKPCSAANTQCAIESCSCAPGDCWWDIDQSYITGCEYKCDLTNNGVEICDGIDNDCDGKIDAADDLGADPTVGVQCFGDPDGECAAPAHAGVTACQGGVVLCTGMDVLTENDKLETCNGKDDDCDGAIDDAPTDAGGFCGQSNIAPCSFGINQCQNGALVCVGSIDPKPEACNGQDDDCDGNIDATNGMPPPDSVGACNVPPPAPPGATQPCMAGAKTCIGGSVVCQGSVGPTSQSDACGDDSNCDGQLTNQPDLASDVSSCGSCGINCYANAMHSIWTCNTGTCQYQGCENGYYDLNNDQLCEYACIYISAQETCNGVDDNCDGQIDEGVIAPSSTQVCGVSPSAVTPECTSQVTVSCTNGAWKCSFPMGVCSQNCSGASCCSGATETCDALDNDCDGAVNENVANYGKPCASDDAAPVPGHGACRTTGTFACTSASSVACSATKADCNNLPGGCAEACDGIDNDCDGSIDESFNAKGSNATYFVKPAVTKLAAAKWIFSYEASRPTATSTAPGTGNGYHCSGAGCVSNLSAPAGEPLDKTRACSVPNNIPWFNVTPIEVEQTCAAIGGKVCATDTEWLVACQAGNTCTWGYAPNDNSCKTANTGTKFCNLGPSFDFSPGTAGDQDGLLPTASSALQGCYADWPAASPQTKIYDITGNLREITKAAANTYPLVGGAFDTGDANGATCSFNFYTVDQNFKLFDVGYRCCFTSDPTL